MVKDILQGLGMKNVWPSIEAKVGTSALANLLTDLITNRNECAHTGRNKVVPSPPELIAFVDALDKISEGIVGVLDDELGKLQPQAIDRPAA